MFMAQPPLLHAPPTGVSLAAAATPSHSGDAAAGASPSNAGGGGGGGVNATAHSNNEKVRRTAFNGTIEALRVGVGLRAGCSKHAVLLATQARLSELSSALAAKSIEAAAAGAARDDAMRTASAAAAAAAAATLGGNGNGGNASGGGSPDGDGDGHALRRGGSGVGESAAVCSADSNADLREREQYARNSSANGGVPLRGEEPRGLYAQFAPAAAAAAAAAAAPSPLTSLAVEVEDHAGSGAAALASACFVRVAGAHRPGLLLDVAAALAPLPLALRQAAVTTPATVRFSMRLRAWQCNLLTCAIRFLFVFF